MKKEAGGEKDTRECTSYFSQCNVRTQQDIHELAKKRQSLAFRASFKLAMYPRMTFSFRSSCLYLQSALTTGIRHHVHVVLAVKS